MRQLPLLVPTNTTTCCINYHYLFRQIPLLVDTPLGIGNLLTLKPCPTGTLECANDEPDPKNNKLEIRGTISPALRHSLARVPLANVSRRMRDIDFAINNANASRPPPDRQAPSSGCGRCGTEDPAPSQSAAGAPSPFTSPPRGPRRTPSTSPRWRPPSGGRSRR